MEVRFALTRRMPGLRVLRHYRREWLRGDLVAGFAVTALMIPHGMAYAELAGVPAVTGLYTTITAVLAYAVFGPSRILLLGPDSSLAPLIAVAIVVVGSNGEPADAIAIASVLALMTGLFCVLAGLSRLGSIAELLSRPVQLGYLNGLAIVMVLSQIAKLAGFSADSDQPLRQFGDFIAGCADGLVNTNALLLGLAALVTIVVLVRVSPTLPGVLIVVVATIGATNSPPISRPLKRLTQRLRLASQHSIAYRPIDEEESSLILNSLRVVGLRKSICSHCGVGAAARQAESRVCSPSTSPTPSAAR